MGICLLVVVAVCLLVGAFLLRRKDRRHRAALQAAREQQLAAAREAEALEAARLAAPPGTIPVVIVQPDGVVILAEQIELPPLTDGGDAQRADPSLKDELPVSRSAQQ